MNRFLLHDRRGASAAEFALVLPLLILLLFGLIDAGRYMWQWNSAEKAAQAGVRMAVVTLPVPQGLIDAAYVGNTSGGPALTQGDPIPLTALGKIVCNNTACCNPASLCTTPYPALGTFNSASFNAIVQRMRFIDPLIQAADVTIEYRGSGLGYAGDPNGMEIAPMVKVNIAKIDLSTLSSMTLLSTRITNISATMTAEDSSGTVSN